MIKYNHSKRIKTVQAPNYFNRRNLKVIKLLIIKEVVYMKKLSRNIVCFLSSAALFCGASSMTAYAETNNINLGSNITELNASLKQGNTLVPNFEPFETHQYPSNNYTKYPSGILKPNEERIDISLKASQKYTDLTITQNEIASGKKVTLEVKTQNTRFYSDFGTVKYQWFGPKGLISGANSKTYETNITGSYYCYAWIDYNFDDDDDNAAVLNKQDNSDVYVPFLRSPQNPYGPQHKRPEAYIWKVPEGAVKTDTATVRLVNEFTIEKQPVNMPLYDYEDSGVDYGAELSVSVSGGSGRYNYKWYNVNSSEPVGFDQIFITYEIGEYYCVITDDQGRTLKTDTAKSIGEYLYCNDTGKKRININNNSESKTMYVNVYAGILDDENITTEFYVEWEEADIFQDNWTKIDSKTTDENVFTKEVTLNKDKQVRYTAYVMVNGRKSGQVTSGVTIVTNPLTATLDSRYNYKDGNDLYARFDVAGGYGDIQFLNASGNKNNRINSFSNWPNYTPTREIVCKAKPHGYVDYTTNELVVEWVCWFAIKDEVGNTNITYGDEYHRGIVVQTDRSPYKG